MNQATNMNVAMDLAPAYFAKRRARLLAQMDENAIAILPTASAKIRNNDAHYPYRADSSFFYLTGFAEPEAVLCLESSIRESYTLFCRARDVQKEIWDGKRAGVQGAIERFGAHQAYTMNELDEQMIVRLANKSVIYTRFGVDVAFDQQLNSWLNVVKSQQRSGVSVPVKLVQIDTLIDEMRLFKDEFEQQLMREAAQISAQAHCRAMRAVHPGMMEYQLDAEYAYVFRQFNCQAAYTSIVGGGANGCILHYIENNQPLKDGDLVLVDAGAELNHYASDITRTFPVNGHFSGAQRDLYQLVLSANEAAIAVAKPGQRWQDMHDASVKCLVQGLLDLGLLAGSVDEQISSGAYTRFYMHRTGHWLGLDVHDVGSYRHHLDHKQSRILEAGMAFTVEPGLYISPDDQQVAEHWRGIGIRIEDDVLLGEQGAEVLTSGVPKSIVDIEQLMAEQ